MITLVKIVSKTIDIPSVLYVAKLFTNSKIKLSIDPKKEVMGPTIKPGSFITMLPPPNKTTVSEIIDDNCVPPKKLLAQIEKNAQRAASAAPIP